MSANSISDCSCKRRDANQRYKEEGVEHRHGDTDVGDFARFGLKLLGLLIQITIELYQERSRYVEAFGHGR